MTFFIIIVVIAVLGIGAVLWLINKEKTTQETTTPNEEDNVTSEMLLNRVGLSPKELDESAATNPEESVPAKKKKFPSFGGKLKFGKKKPPPEEVPEATPFPMLKDYLKSEENRQQEENISKKPMPSISNTPQSGTASVTTQTNEGGAVKPQIRVSKEDAPPPAEPVPNTPNNQNNEDEPKDSPSLSETENANIEKEIDSSLELSELKTKYEKLDKMLKEKNDELEKAQNSLNTELKNRKDFNKVKDLLEKELKEVRMKARDTQVELNAVQAEGESYKKRIGQLEDKATKLEKIILDKEEEIDEINKKYKSAVNKELAAARPEPEQQEQPAQPSEDAPQESAPPPPTAESTPNTDDPIQQNEEPTQQPPEQPVQQTVQPPEPPPEEKTIEEKTEEVAPPPEPEPIPEPEPVVPEPEPIPEPPKDEIPSPPSDINIEEPTIQQEPNDGVYKIDTSDEQEEYQKLRPDITEQTPTEPINEEPQPNIENPAEENQDNEHDKPKE